MDRGHAELAARIDGLHPAVLRLIDVTMQGRRACIGMPVAVCGGLASDPAAVPVLLGLGVTELSVVPTLIPQLKALIRGLTLDACRALAQRALAARDRGARCARWCARRLHEETHLEAAAHRAARSCCPSRCCRWRRCCCGSASRTCSTCPPSPRPATRSSRTSACCSPSAWRSASRARITAPRGLPRVVGYLVATQGAKVLIDVPPEVTAGCPGCSSRTSPPAAFRAKELAKLSVPVGLLSGLIAGWAYNRFSDIRLPGYLAFFGGRRFVPIVSGFAGVVLALAFGFGWPTLEHGMDAVSQAVLGSEEIGLFAYGVLNRVLIVTGLHHIINNIAWFLLGDYNGVTGDLKRFFAGDPSAGAFMSGFFPVMMFGLPGACLAMYRTASPARRAAVGGMLLSMALTSFLTGVTEPIEFAFMFLAPVLYAIHAVLTGVAMVLMHALDVHLGFGFSAGPVRLRAQLLAVDAAAAADPRSGSPTSRCTTSCSASASCASI